MDRRVKTDRRRTWQISAKHPTHERMRRVLPQPKFGAGQRGKDLHAPAISAPTLASSSALSFSPDHAMMLFFSAVMAALLIIPGVYASSFVAAAGEISQALPRHVWVQRFVFVLQTFALPFAVYFRPLCILVAVSWLVYRASGVIHKPLDELSSLLGFDIPAAPRIELADIKADGAIVRWGISEKLKARSSHKYAVYLNGMIVGTVASNESAVTINGLLPDGYYIVRVALMTNHDFSSKSKPIRFRSKPASSGDYFIPTSLDGNETDAEGVHESVARVRPYRGLKDITPAPPVSAPMARSGSSGLETRRSITGRRLSPGALGLDNKHDPHPDDNEAPEGAETIQQLTKKLDAIRRETDEAERTAKEEEEEEQRARDELAKERDELRADLNEKEKASKTLKREANTAERQNTQAQNERLKQKRLLDSKISEREKLKTDVVQWDQETAKMNAEAVRLREEKERCVTQAAKEKEELRAQLHDETGRVRELDEQVKEKAAEIKRIERAHKEGPPSGTETEPNLVQQFQQDAEEERAHNTTLSSLQQQYAMIYQRVDAAKRFHAEQVRYLEALRADRRRQDENQVQFASPPPTQERLPRRENSQRSRNAVSRHSVSDSPRLVAFGVNPSPFATHPNPAAAYLNMQNGMTLGAPTDAVSMSEEDRLQLTGGAAMSPGVAADLLPRDLFSNDDRNMLEQVQPLPGLGSLPGLPNRGAPLPPPNSHDLPGMDPASPGSGSSRSPSVFASPRASQNNLILGSPGDFMDADRRSIRSTRSNRAPSGSTTSRFSGMFGIKQRNKTMSEEGPPLSKASSMPRGDQVVPGLDSVARKRNSSISGTVFQGPNLDGSTDAPAVPGRRGFGWLSRDKTGGWPSAFTGSFGRRPTSPRPGSTHSIELPRPSMDSTRWGIGAGAADAAGGARNSPLAFGPGWNLPASQQSRFHGSRHPSRRQSMQYGASGPPEDILEDDDSDALDPDEVSNLAPIGTKPSPGSKKADTAAKLNPNAKDFKSFFKFGSKDKSKDRSASRDRSEPLTQVQSGATTPMEEEESPPNSRKSKDVYSLATTESSVAESGRPSSDLARTPSYSNSDVPSPSLAGSSKETFMQKITRKSSSGKFALPTFKREKSHLNPSSAATSAPYVSEQDEEDDMSTSVGSLRESSQLGSAKGSAELKDGKDGARDSKEGNRSSRSWSSVLKIGGKKKGNETPSLSGMSVTTSGTEEAEEEGEEEEMLVAQ